MNKSFICSNLSILQRGVINRFCAKRYFTTGLNSHNSNEFDVFIVGGGVSGTSLYYILSQYTNINRIALCERRSKYAMVASYAKNNSQTIHCGDIETNYTFESAKKVKRSANILRNFLMTLPKTLLPSIAIEGQKMVIGVGDVECDFIEKRYKPFKELFPHMQYLTKDQILQVEPNVIYTDIAKKTKRADEVNALYLDKELTTINFTQLSHTFVDSAHTLDKHLVSMLNTEVYSVVKSGNKFKLTTNNGIFYSSFVVFSTCGYSLLFAHKMNLGLEYSVLPVAGSFYFTKELLRGKVYTVQNPQLPFAAIHGDPDIVANNQTRIGPTALPLPLLERYNISSFTDFLRVFKFDHNVLITYFNLIKQSTIRNYIIKNFLFEIPILSRLIFVRDARKILPSLKFKDVRYSVGYGGIRPQLVNKKERKLLFGESKIKSDGCIFNITASPGATTCLANAELDMRDICKHLNANIDEEKLKRNLFQGAYEIV